MTTAAATAETTASTLGSLLAAADVTSERLAAHLDALASDERIQQCRALSKQQLARLGGAAGAAGAAVAPGDFGAGAGDGTPVEFAGKNSLAAFTHFEKHFVRHDGKLVGI